MVTRGQTGRFLPRSKSRITAIPWKRAFDIGFSLSVLVLLFPLYLAIAALIYFTSSGSIFYRQQRVGKDGRIFSCIKFRTMMIGADQILQDLLEQCPHQKAEFESSFKLKNDPRITPIGKWLRLTSLDELPQFWHVLTGEMSVVGPRPLVVEELSRYGNAIDQVLSVRPGITGLWQVSGRNDLPYPRRVQLDLYYARHHNFGLDLWIVLKTVAIVIFPKGNGAY
ncbi:glycosyl transferase possibly involved in lipopolysaccharide synthesis [Synechococcus sp. PCC 7502]|uniref:sugar transferase n=1 Tax=Synechococcus sp. PCC 7502 TaxID=1173263 RepID=UPI00029F9B34|nr:sugar transferase [Synechococcus sp. PCC 7502]AFY74460.1 glycosyl transferase possibly involved in lipopolysaccharide synthesis [Synechococcus sp. PCC 7502]